MTRRKAHVEPGIQRQVARRWSVEGALQAVIMLVIGGAAGAASFRHVHDVAVAHGQPGWLAWADAVVLELMSIASGLELRRRKRLHAPLRFPAAVLGVAVFLSLGAQVVEAEPSVIGWIAAAIPAAGFLVMVKIALVPVGAPEVSVVDAEMGSSRVFSVAGRDLPSMASSGAAASSAAGVDSPGLGVSPEAVSGEEDPVVQVLVPAARAAAEALHKQGRRVTRKALADVLRADGYGVSNARASQLLKQVAQEMSGSMSPTGLPGVLPASRARVAGQAS